MRVRRLYFAAYAALLASVMVAVESVHLEQRAWLRWVHLDAEGIFFVRCGAVLIGLVATVLWLEAYQKSKHLTLHIPREE